MRQACRRQEFSGRSMAMRALVRSWLAMAAFTLIELLVVVAIIAILPLVSL